MVNKDLMDVESDSDLNNSDSDDGLNDEDDKLLSDSEDEVVTKAKAANAKAGKDVESSGSSDDEEEEKNAFINPLSLAAKKGKGKKVEGEISDGEWSDEGENKREKGGKSDASKKAKKALGKRANNERDKEDDQAREFFGKSTFEEVPANQPAEDKNDESLDSTEIAETRVLAKKMLRKKQRTELLDSTYNRYSFHEPTFDLPNWFVTDESKHYFRHYNASKDEIMAEK